MKWANYHQAETPRDALIQAVLVGVISNELQVASATGEFGWTFDKALLPGPGVGGDPHWEIGYLDEPDGPGKFELYASPESYFIEPDTGVYSVDEIFDTVAQLLRAYGVAYPNEKSVADHELERLPAYRLKFKD
jgi:hypothetical protein